MLPILGLSQSMSLAPRQGRVPSAAHSYTAPSPPRHLLPTSCRSFGCRRRHAPCVAAARPRHKAQKALRAEARSSAHVWPQQPQVPLHAHTRQTRSVSARASAASSAGAFLPVSLQRRHQVPSSSRVCTCSKPRAQRGACAWQPVEGTLAGHQLLLLLHGRGHPLVCHYAGTGAFHGSL